MGLPHLRCLWCFLSLSLQLPQARWLVVPGRVWGCLVLVVTTCNLTRAILYAEPLVACEVVWSLWSRPAASRGPILYAEPLPPDRQKRPPVWAFVYAYSSLILLPGDHQLELQDRSTCRQVSGPARLPVPIRITMILCEGRSVNTSLRLFWEQRYRYLQARVGSALEIMVLGEMPIGQLVGRCVALGTLNLLCFRGSLQTTHKNEKRKNERWCYVSRGVDTTEPLRSTLAEHSCEPSHMIECGVRTVTDDNPIS